MAWNEFSLSVTCLCDVDSGLC